MLGKIELVLFDHAHGFDGIDVKMDGFVLDEKLSLKILQLTISSRLDRDLCFVSIAKTTPKKIVVLIYSLKFLFSDFAICLISRMTLPL